jgi:hypothetical protein
MRKLFNQAVELTQEEAINHPRREYNPRIWKREIESYAKYDGKFYDLGKGNSEYSQGEVGVVYEIEGVRQFRVVEYSASLSAYDGVGRVFVSADGVHFEKFRNAEGVEGHISYRKNLPFLRRMCDNFPSFNVGLASL